MSVLPQRYPWTTRTPAEMPKELQSKLAATEVSILGGQIHEARMIEPVLTTLAAFMAMVILVPRAPEGSSAIPNLFILAFFVAVIRLAWQYFIWGHNLIFFTGYRIIYVSGIFTRNIAMIPVGKVTDMGYLKTLPGQALNYGKFVIESAGQVQALREINFVPEPDDTYRYLQNLIFGKGTTNVNIVDINLINPRKTLPVSLKNRLRATGTGRNQGSGSVIDEDESPWWTDQK